jgi:hypothetical protein
MILCLKQTPVRRDNIPGRSIGAKEAERLRFV